MPEGWAWCRLGELFYHTTGKALKKSNNKGSLRKYITTSNLYWNKFDFTEVREMYFTDDELDKCTIKKGDLVLCNGGDVGRAAIWNFDEDICYQNHVSRLRPKIIGINNKLYLYLLMFYKEQGMLNGKGVGITSLSANDLLSGLFPLPPINEQDQIVIKIENIFSQIDYIDDNKSDLQTAINKTKSKILDLAIHGKLVPQDSNDEPAEELLKRIATSDNRPYEKFKESEKLFEAPENWSWCYLKETCTDFIVPQRDKPKVFDGTIPWCRIEDIEGKYLNGSLSNQLVSKDTIKQMNMHICPVGSVICSCSASLGIQAITTIECCTNQTFIGIVPIESVLYNEYLFYYLKAQTKYFHKIATGTTIKYISRDKFEELPFALPPFEEQKRIVSKIENLFTVLDEVVLNLV